MNTDTGNIFSFNKDGQPLATNEVELTRKQFQDLFPVRDLTKRLDLYEAMKAEESAPTASELAAKIEQLKSQLANE